nr:rhomboid family intramembrane serine protease [Acanthopleuribacter pedis]
MENGYYWTLLTSAFSHNQIIHLVFNMMVLVSFGNLLEKFYGPVGFLKLYIGAALFSSLMHCATSAFLMDRMDANALGASGALTAVLMVFARMWPKHKILLFGIIPVPAMIAVVGLVLLDIWGLIAQTRGGGFQIGHSAHLGGTIFGFVYFQTILAKRIVRDVNETH